MNCCDDYGDCQQGRDCPVRNATTRTYPRTLSEAFPRNPEWREHDSHGDDWDFVITILGIVLIGLTLVLTWLGH